MCTLIIIQISAQTGMPTTSIKCCKFSLESGAGARQHYDAIIEKGRETRTYITWSKLEESFAIRYASSLTIQAEISRRLKSIAVEDVKRDGEMTIERQEDFPTASTN